MQHPTWTDFEEHKDDFEGGFFYVGFWKGVGRNGKEITVPCVYSDSDVERNTPAQIEHLKQELKDRGLKAWYDAEEWGYYNDQQQDEEELFYGPDEPS